MAAYVYVYTASTNVENRRVTSNSHKETSLLDWILNLQGEGSAHVREERGRAPRRAPTNHMTRLLEGMSILMILAI